MAKEVQVAKFRYQPLTTPKKKELQQIFITFSCLFLCFILAKKTLASDHHLVNKAPYAIEFGYPDQSIFVAATNSQEKVSTPMLILAKELLNQSNIAWHATPYPAKRLFHNLKNGATGFSILVKSSSLLDSCIFSSKPVYRTHLNVYYKDGAARIVKKEDLRNKRIITIRGYSYGKLLEFISHPENNITNTSTTTHMSAFKMLKMGRADYVLDYASAASDIIPNLAFTNLISTPICQLDIFLVLSKAHPDAEQLMEQFEQILATLNVQKLIESKPML